MDVIAILIGALGVLIGLPALIWGRATFQGIDLSQRASRLLGLVVVLIGLAMLVLRGILGEQ